LLRFLQEKAYERVGDLHTRKADVRIITATNVDLEAAVRSGGFREDLFYRLNVVEIVLPPLRERRQDILPLARRLLVFFARQNHRSPPDLSHEAQQALENHPWPGNVRELRNAIERAILLGNDQLIGLEDLPIKRVAAESLPSIGDPITLEKLEEMHIRRVLATTRSLDDASRMLGMDSVTLWRRRKKYGI